MSKLRIGLIGSGFVQDFHMEAFREIPNVDVVAVGSFTKEKAKKFADKWKIPNYFSGDDAIQKVCTLKEVDAVLICIPNDLHLNAVKIASENHKHVICEKPLGRTGLEAREMLKIVEKSGVLHGYAENQAFFPLYMAAYENIKLNKLGNVYLVRSREAHFGPHSPWFWDPARSGGGVALDMGCHSVEVARKCFGNDTPVEAIMWADTLVHKTKAEDNCTIMVRYKNKQMGQAENSWSAHGGLDLRTEIYGSEGVLFMDNTRETGMKMFTNIQMDYVVEKAESFKGWMYPLPNEYRVYGYYDEDKHFVKSFLEGNLPSENFKDGVIVNSILDAGYKSIKSKKWEPVEL